jgi:hypothetical protein
MDQAIKNYIHKFIKKVQYHLLQRLYTKYIINKFDEFSHRLKKIAIKPCFKGLEKLTYSDIMNMKFKRRKISQESSIDWSTRNFPQIETSLIPTPKFTKRDILTCDIFTYPNVEGTLESNSYKRKNTDYIRSGDNSFFSRKAYESDDFKENERFKKRVNTSISMSISSGYVNILLKLLEKIINIRRKMTYHILRVVMGNKAKNRVYSIRILHRLIKRRIYFYKLKLMNRCKLILI